MANIIKIKRGLKADIDKLTLQAGELGVTLDTQELYVGDANGNRQLIKGAAAGVVETATKLESPRNIKISGDATGSTSFDGSADATIALTLANSGVTAGSYNKVTVNAKGLVTSGENVVYTITDISGLEDALDAKADASSVYTKTDIDGKVETINNSIATKANNSDLTALQGTVAGHTTSIGNLETDVAKKANSADVYTKEEANALLQTKADATSVYTSSKVDELLGKKANTADLGTLATKSEVVKADLATALANELDAKATTSAMTEALALKADKTTVEGLETTLTNKINEKATKATTLEGYGITDAYTKTQVDGMIAGTFSFKGSKNSLDELNALTGMKAGDVYQVGEKEYAYNGSQWVELGFNIDLSAYAKSEDIAKTYATQTALSEGLELKANSADVYTKTEANGLLDAKATVTDLNALTTRVTTAEGDIDALEGGKADKATTLAGYGITDAYTQTQINTALGEKADKATTLAGYNISDAYTETEVDNLLSPITTTLATKLDASSTIDGGTF